PGRTLGVLTMQHPDRREGGDAVPVSSIRPEYEHQSDVEYLCHGIGRVWVSGVDIKWEGLTGAVGPVRRVPLPTYPFERQLHWLEPVTVADAPAVSGAPGSVRTSVHKNPDPAHWLYAPSWKRLLPPAIGLDHGALPAAQAGTWLVCA